MKLLSFRTLLVLILIGSLSSCAKDELVWTLRNYFKQGNNFDTALYLPTRQDPYNVIRTTSNDLVIADDAVIIQSFQLRIPIERYTHMSVNYASRVNPSDPLVIAKMDIYFQYQP